MWAVRCCGRQGSFDALQEQLGKVESSVRAESRRGTRLMQSALESMSLIRAHLTHGLAVVHEAAAGASGGSLALGGKQAPRQASLPPINGIQSSRPPNGREPCRRSPRCKLPTSLEDGAQHHHRLRTLLPERHEPPSARCIPWTVHYGHHSSSPPSVRQVESWACARACAEKTDSHELPLEPQPPGQPSRSAPQYRRSLGSQSRTGCV